MDVWQMQTTQITKRATFFEKKSPKTHAAQAQRWETHRHPLIVWSQNTVPSNRQAQEGKHTRAKRWIGCMGRQEEATTEQTNKQQRKSTRWHGTMSQETNLRQAHDATTANLSDRNDAEEDEEERPGHSPEPVGIGDSKRAWDFRKGRVSTLASLQCSTVSSSFRGPPDIVR